MPWRRRRARIDWPFLLFWFAYLGAAALGMAHFMGKI